MYPSSCIPRRVVWSDSDPQAGTDYPLASFKRQVADRHRGGSYAQSDDAAFELLIDGVSSRAHFSLDF